MPENGEEIGPIGYAILNALMGRTEDIREHEARLKRAQWQVEQSQSALDEARSDVAAYRAELAARGINTDEASSE